MIQTALLLLASLAPAAPLPQAVDSTHASPIDPAVWTTKGSIVPDVELARVDGGGLVRLSDYRGKRLLLIHFASW